MIPRRVPYEVEVPRRENIVTVAMCGITSTRAQLSRYTGSDGIVVLENALDNDECSSHASNLGEVRPTPSFSYCTFSNRHEGRSYFAILMEGLQRLLHPELEHSRKATAEEKHRLKGDAALSEENVAKGGGLQNASLQSFHPSSQQGSGYDEQAMRRQPRVEAGSRLETDIETLPAPPQSYRAVCRVAPRLLHHVLPSPEVTEMRHRRWYCTINPVHWLLTLKEVMTCLWFSTRPLQWCYSEHGRTNLGGARDQAYFINEVRRAVMMITSEEAAAEKRGAASIAASPVPSIVPKKHLVLFGASRGATTCFYAAMRLPRVLAQYVSLVILEAPFDTLEHVINASCWFPRLVTWYFRSFCDWRGVKEERDAYDFDAAAVQLRCPIAFVISKRDARVPNACTQVLIDRVRRELVPHIIPAVEVLVLKHSRHPCMAVGNREDQDAYVSFVERLYQRYCPLSS